MNEEKLGFFKKELETKLENLRAKYATKDLLEKAKSYAMSDINDIAASEIERSEYFHIREKEISSMGQIEAALKKIEEGDFGVCDSCGEEISEKRLLAYPLTMLCFDCQTEVEDKK